ncbi:hypothetical protein SDC9_23767 [bioreactor metagenome]|uniref:Uncharacterized protein n=1 Tax=bioreactor metagenome TaxID=1076179 RepID=A0A644UFY8_9ZZZZ
MRRYPADHRRETCRRLRPSREDIGDVVESVAPLFRTADGGRPGDIGHFGDPFDLTEGKSRRFFLFSADDEVARVHAHPAFFRADGPSVGADEDTVFYGDLIHRHRTE